MRAALYSFLIATSILLGQTQPAWRQMRLEGSAFAIRYPTSATAAWLEEVKRAIQPSAAFEQKRILFWEQGSAATIEGRIRSLDNRIRTNRIAVYRLGPVALIPSGELIVVFREKVRRAEALAIFKRNQLLVVELPGEYSKRQYLARLVSDDGVQSVKLAARIGKLPQVEIAEPNLLSISPPDPLR